MKRSSTLLLFLLFPSIALAATATLPTAQGPQAPAGSSAAELEQRDRQAEARIQQLNQRGAMTNEATMATASSDETIVYTYPNAQFTVSYYSNGRVRTVTGEDPGEFAFKYRYDYTYASNGMLTQIKRTLQSKDDPDFTDTWTTGYGLDARGRYALLWETNIGRYSSGAVAYSTRLNYNYWYDSSNASRRNFQVREASSGKLRRQGYETLDSQGRVVASYSNEGGGSVRRKTFTFTTQNGNPSVTERTWDNAPTSYTPDLVRDYRIHRTIRLQTRQVSNTFYADRSRPPYRSEIRTYSYNI